MDDILDFLATHVLDPIYTDAIGQKFNDILLLIATKCFTLDEENLPLSLHQRRCVALSKLIKYSAEVQKLVMK